MSTEGAMSRANLAGKGRAASASACGEGLIISIGYITRAVLAVPEAVSSLLSLFAPVEHRFRTALNECWDGDL